MSEEQSRSRILLVDASVFITLAAVDATDTLVNLPGDTAMPTAVANEIEDEPASGVLEDLRTNGDIRIIRGGKVPARRAARHLGQSPDDENGGATLAAGIEGDVALLAYALAFDDRDDGDPVVITDDKPLRETCKALSVPLSGSIGVLVRAVERSDIEPTEAKEALYAMDEVGARLSASLIKKAERMIDEAADGS